MTKKSKFRILQAVAGIGAGVLFTLSLAAGVAGAETPDTNGDGSTDSSTDTGASGGKSLGDIIHDIFCPPEKDGDDEAEKPADDKPSAPEVKVETPAKPVVTDTNNEPPCSLIKTSPNYCYK